MNGSEIADFVACYLIQMSDKLEPGTVNQDRFYAVRGPMTDSPGTTVQTLYGTHIDILAQLLEGNQYFGIWEDGTAGELIREDNAQITALGEYSVAENVTGTVRKDNGHFTFLPDRIPLRTYLTPLRKKDGFITYCKSLRVVDSGLLLENGKARLPDGKQTSIEDIADMLY